MFDETTGTFLVDETSELTKASIQFFKDKLTVPKHVERLDVFVDFVLGLKRLSKCEDRQTAAIIVNEDFTQVYSIGINGGPKGSIINCLCKLPGKYTCVHAEANAIAKCTTQDNKKIMICSLSPCVTCAALIANAGFKAVYYLEQWKDPTGIQLLNEAGIITSHFVKGSR